MWRPTGAFGAVLVAALLATGCAADHHEAAFVIPVATTARAASSPSIFLPSGASPDDLPSVVTAAALVDREPLRAFLVVDADFPRTGIHISAQPDGSLGPRVELCAGHNPEGDYAASLTVGADIFTPSGNGIEIVMAYTPGVAEQMLAAVNEAFVACARNAPISVGQLIGTVTYSRVRLSVTSSHKEVAAATRMVTLAGATYESGLAYARFGDLVVLMQLDNISAKSAASLLNRLLKPVVARHR